MSLHEPSVWLRNHRVLVDGVGKQREKDQPVGALMSTWRELRRKHPSLFKAGVRV